jgi:hypothetical protein
MHDDTAQAAAGKSTGPWKKYFFAGTYGGFSQVGFEAAAGTECGASTDLRLLTIGMARMNDAGHAEFKPDELTALLGRSPQAVKVARTKLYKMGLLVELSGDTCLWFSSHLLQRAHLGSRLCRHHGHAERGQAPVVREPDPVRVEAGKRAAKARAGTSNVLTPVRETYQGNPAACDDAASSIESFCLESEGQNQAATEEGQPTAPPVIPVAASTLDDMTTGLIQALSQSCAKCGRSGVTVTLDADGTCIRCAFGEVRLTVPEYDPWDIAPVRHLSLVRAG